jgi:hypothetical protein
MKKVLFGLALVFSFSSFAASMECKSVSYTLTFNDIKGEAYANYAINGNVNDGADVEIEKMHLTDRVFAAALTVDGQKRKFEVVANLVAKGKFQGRIYSGVRFQPAVCNLTE